MFKRVCATSLKEGTDADAFWKYWTKEHAPHIIEYGGPGEVKYVIYRVIKTIHGEKPFFAFAEEVFEDEEAANKNTETLKVTRLPSGKTIFEDFESRQALGNNFSFVAEEFIAKDPGTRIYATKENRVVKRVLATPPKAESDEEDAFWKYWVKEGAPAIVKASGPGLLKYVLNRVARVRWGEKMFFVLMEMWFQDEEAMNRAVEAWKTVKLPDGQSMSEFESKGAGNWVALVEEFVVRG